MVYHDIKNAGRKVNYEKWIQWIFQAVFWLKYAIKFSIWEFHRSNRQNKTTVSYEYFLWTWLYIIKADNDSNECPCKWVVGFGGVTTITTICILRLIKLPVILKLYQHLSKVTLKLWKLNPLAECQIIINKKRFLALSIWAFCFLFDIFSWSLLCTLLFFVCLFSVFFCFFFL